MMLKVSCSDVSVFITSKSQLAAGFVEHLLLRDFGPYGTIHTNVCVTAVAMVILLTNFRTCGIV
jgi:hypothetical protein